jgi:hypothetical protein
MENFYDRSLQWSPAERMSTYFGSGETMGENFDASPPAENIAPEIILRSLA